MIELDLNDAEARILAEILENVLSDLRMEIADTDRQDYRQMLKGRKGALEKTLKQLRGGEGGG